MTRTVLLVAALVVSTAMLVSTGAFPLSDGTDEVAQVDIEMSPADGPNGKYAVINENEEIELMLTGENPDQVSDGITEDTLVPIDRVFTITNTGDETARLWISDDADDVQFYRGSDSSDSLEGPTNEVELAPAETVAVGLLVDTRGDHDVESVSGFTVHAEQGTPTPTLTPTPTVTPETTTAEPTATPDPTPETTTVEPSETTTVTPTPEPTTAATTTTQPPSTETTQSGQTGETTTVSGGLGDPGSGETTTVGGNGAATETTASSAAGDDGDTGGFPSEIGGVGSGLLWLLVLLLAVLVALATYRRYRDS